MKSNYIQELIVKYLTRSISAEEMEELEVALKTPSNEEMFSKFTEINYFIDHKMNSYNTEKSKSLLINKIRKDKRRSFQPKIKSILKYAAVIGISIGIGYLANELLSINAPIKNNISTNNFVTLELEDGNIQVISEDGTSEVRDAHGKLIGSQNGHQLVYTNNSKTITSVPIYNTLHVPNGKHFELQLSDGTVAHLNAGSSIKYPVVFAEKQERKVFLTGEAFLDVAKDTARPFLVAADDFKIKVFGTKFNVSAYPEDKTKEVVLVEGSVGLYSENNFTDKKEGTMLTPGFKGSYDIADGSITTEPVITSIYTSWVQGVLVFRNMTFENILKKLERHYDVQIINNNIKLSGEKFNASFDDMPIEQVLAYFKGAYEINYSITDDDLIIVY